jgi:thioesterase domain-containing protein
MIETAAFEYRPKQYQGKVLLLLASERPPHVNYLPGWQAVIPDNLHTQYVEGHHRNLITAPYVEGIADAIISHLNSSSDLPNKREAMTAGREH